MVAAVMSENRRPFQGRRDDPPPPKIRTLAVTGGTGFVGSHLLRLALAPKAMTFAPSPAAGSRPRTRSPGSTAPSTGPRPWSNWSPAPTPSSTSPERSTPAPSRLSRRSTSAGTATMIDAARKAGVRRFVHISSLAAREPDLSDYGWSKARSERLVAASGLDWTIVRPPAIYGPGDRETFELFKMARRGLVALPPRAASRSSMSRTCAGLILALLDDPDSWAETYEPDDGREGGWQHRHFARTLGRIYGRRAPPSPCPAPVLRSPRRLDRLFRRGNAKLTRDRVGYFCHPDWVAAAERRPPSASGRRRSRPPPASRRPPTGIASRAGCAEILPVAQRWGGGRSEAWWRGLAMPLAPPPRFTRSPSPRASPRGG